MHFSTLTVSVVAIAGSLAAAFPNNLNAASIDKRQSGSGIQTFLASDNTCATEPLSSGEVYPLNVGGCIPQFSDQNGNVIGVGSILPVNEPSTAVFQMYTSFGAGCTGSFITSNAGSNCQTASAPIFAVARVG
jgi:hypothetical protein